MFAWITCRKDLTFSGNSSGFVSELLLMLSMKLHNAICDAQRAHNQAPRQHSHVHKRTCVAHYHPDARKYKPLL